uniref:Uncharacterized protein n=1 Tax=viral metagenome TaxID=1070528 RepID=A0A6C0CKZ0_9ZZZZ
MNTPKFNRTTIHLNGEECSEDVTRYSHLHSWYKHLNAFPKYNKNYVYPDLGQKPCNSLSPMTDDGEDDKYHIWFMDAMCLDKIPDDVLTETQKKIVDIIKKYPAYLNSSFGDETKFVVNDATGCAMVVCRHLAEKKNLKHFLI